MKIIILSAVLFFVTFSNALAAQQAIYILFTPYSQNSMGATSELNKWIKENEKTKKIVSFQFQGLVNNASRLVGVWILYEDVPFKPAKTGRRSEHD